MTLLVKLFLESLLSTVLLILTKKQCGIASVFVEKKPLLIVIALRLGKQNRVVATEMN